MGFSPGQGSACVFCFCSTLWFSPGWGAACVFCVWYFVGVLFHISFFPSLAGGLPVLFFFCLCIVVSCITWFFFLSFLLDPLGLVVCVLFVFDLLSLFSVLSLPLLFLEFPMPGVCLLTFGGVLFVLVIVVHQFLNLCCFCCFLVFRVSYFCFFPWYSGVKAVLTFLILLLCTFGRFYLFWG